MTQNTNDPHPSRPLLSFSERQQLIQLCRWWTGDPEVAEDLVQETLLIAWRQLDQLRDPARLSQWLTSIACNRCRQWVRSQRRQRRHLAEHDPFSSVLAPDVIDPVAFDVEIELERSELADLLDQALAQLPPLTRAVLIERYIHESPQAEVARQLQMSEGAVEQRIQRGKLALRRILTTDLHEEAAVFGLTPSTASWQESRMWCPCCGAQKLRVMLTSGSDRSLGLRCAACSANFGADLPGLFDGIQSHRAALSRFAQWYYTYFQQGLMQGSVACPKCGRDIPLHRAPAPGMPSAFVDLPPATPGSYGFWLHCAQCSNGSYQSDLAAFAFFVPATQQFWRNHPRMKVLPERAVEREGRMALLLTFQEVDTGKQLDLFFDHTSLTFLEAHST